jgi:hypothetical protein
MNVSFALHQDDCEECSLRIFFTLIDLDFAIFRVSTGFLSTRHVGVLTLCKDRSK